MFEWSHKNREKVSQWVVISQSFNQSRSKSYKSWRVDPGAIVVFWLQYITHLQETWFLNMFAMCTHCA